MKIKKILAALLALLTVTSVMSGCASDSADDTADTTASGGNVQDDITEAVETTAPKPQLELETKNWGGKEFRVLGRADNTYAQFSNFEIASEGINGDIINDAVHKRNGDIKEKYGVTVTQISSAAPAQMLQNSVNSGDDVIDLSFNIQAELTGLAAGGYFIDFYTLPHIDWEKPWWNDEVNKAISIENRLYFTTGAFNVMDKNRMYLLMFNKDMAEEFSLGNMYELVDKGQFTAENVTKFNKEVTADIDGDGEMTADDRWGWGGDSWIASLAAFQSMDNMFVEKDANDYPVITINNDRTVTSIEKMLVMTVDKVTSYTCEMFSGKVDYDFYDVSSNMFEDGRLLFCPNFINFPIGIKNFSAECDFNYGIIPFPKLDEAQENYVSVPDSYWGTLLAVPKTITDPEYIGYMLEVLSYTTQETVMPAFYETSAKGKYTYDEESARMLDLIFSNPRYDLGVIFNWGGMGNIILQLASENSSNFASKYAGVADSAQTALENTVKMFAEIE